MVNGKRSEVSLLINVCPTISACKIAPTDGEDDDVHDTAVLSQCPYNQLGAILSF